MNNIGPIQEKIIIFLREGKGYGLISEEWFRSFGRNEHFTGSSWEEIKASRDRLIARGIVEMNEMQYCFLKKMRGYLDAK